VTGTTREPPVAAPAPPRAADLLRLVGEVAGELHPHRPHRPEAPPTLDSSLERELGFDSLGRLELAMRLERRFEVRLPEALAAAAETPRDLLRAIAAAKPVASAALEREAEAAVVAPAALAALPDAAPTLLDAVRWHAERHPERRHVRFEPGEGEPPQDLTYGELWTRALRVAEGLRDLGLAPGESVALMLPTGLDYFAAFLGIQAAGGVPVPVYPPARPSQVEDHLRRVAKILQTARARVLVAFPEVLTLARLLRSLVPGLERVTTVGGLESPADGPGRAPAPPLPVRAADLAFLQFTSGSTAAPKGVILTHANLLANLRSMGRALDLSGGDVVVSWLPLYHDMGLIGAWMGSLYYGMPLVLLSPISFLSRPARWLWAIHRHRGTTSAAPNFAYELCAAKVAEEEIAGLDLSSWRLALNGAEPVSPQTLDRFAARFAAHGFRRQALLPVYGLAEGSLGLAFPPAGREPRVDLVRRDRFLETGVAGPAAPTEAGAVRFVSCGLPIPGHELRVVDEAGRELGERRQGRIQFRGPSATLGYFHDPEATRRLFDGDWLETGDLGYVAAGELYVTGRVKDLIIRGGRNFHPQELEEAVGALPGVRKGCVAVFGTTDPRSGTERLVVLAETRQPSGSDAAAHAEVRRAIERAAIDLLGSPPDDVALVTPHTVAKTSSGKIRRAACRALYESGAHADHRGRRRSVRWQLLRLAGSGLRPWIARQRRAAATTAYAAWAWALFGGAALLFWPLLAVVPGRARRRRLARAAARSLVRLGGVSLRVEGAECLQDAGAVVVAANHQSYLDSILLAAALPPRFAYVAKRELRRNLFARLALDRLGTVYVERFDPGRGIEDTRRAVAAARAGESLVVFPEGTFERAPGLLPFRLGGFLVAAEAHLPVVPVTLRGTRSLLRGGSWFPRRGPVTVAVAAPLETPAPATGGGEDAWSAAVALRDAARAAILRSCGEPDLAAPPGRG
jgi:1-acyl-sn-glycerol-3-phosphate acyltransferase